MKIEILGCSGGVAQGLRTTSILVNDSVLIDAGTGVGDLSLKKLMKIEHVFLTHSHLDHTVGLPLFADTIFQRLIEKPLNIYARKETLIALQAHVFNDVMWPDFAKLPSPEKAAIRYVEIQDSQRVSLQEVVIRAVDVAHAVPSLGYCVESTGGVFAFSGDTMTNQTLWPVLNAYHNLSVLVIEVSFPNSMEELARQSGHYCPKTVVRDLAQLNHEPEIWVTAMKPGAEDVIFEEVSLALPERSLKRLRSGDTFEL
ncbi:MAG: 3',5'-cyclic-nucleotide phosphodiesterase [Pseudomonadota bacterium]